MKIPDSLPWEMRECMGAVELTTGTNKWICQFWSKQEEAFSDAEANAQYIVTAANMLPELVDMIDKLASKIEKFHFDSNEDDLYAEELMLKAEELLNRIKTGEKR